MPFDTKCPECDAEFRLLDRDRGKRFRCENCSHDFIPRETKEEGRPRRNSPPVQEEKASRAAGGYWNEKRPGGGAKKTDDDGGGRKPARSGRRTREPGGGDNSGVYIAIGVAAFLVLAAGGLCIWIFTQDPEPEPPNQPNQFAGGNINNNNPWPGPGNNPNPPPQQQPNDLDSDTLLGRLDPNNGLAHWDRKTAMDELVSRKEQRAIAPCARLLTSFFDRGNAQNALKAFGPAARTEVLGYFNHADQGVRDAARTLISDWRTSTDDLADRCLKDANGSSLDPQINALLWLAEQNPIPARAPAAARVQERLLQSSDGRLREAAMKGLLKWGTKRNTPAVVKMLETQVKEVFPTNLHRWGFEALGQWKDPRGAPILLLYLPNGFMGGDATKALEQIGPEAAKDVVKFVNHPDGNIHNRARQLLKKYGTDEAMLLAQSLEDLKAADGNQRRAALDWLAQAKPDEEKRAETAKVLAALLADRDHSTQDAALKALKVWIHKDATPALAAALEANADFGAVFRRAQILDVMGGLKDERAAAAISRLIPSFHDRGAASKALKAIGPPAEGEVIKLLIHQDMGTRQEACRILAEIGTAKSLPALAKLAQGNMFDFSVREARMAMDAIRNRLKAS